MSYLFTVVTGCETRNKYMVQNNLGQNIFEAKEGLNFQFSKFNIH